jgi:hypothetical protein
VAARAAGSASRVMNATTGIPRLDLLVFMKFSDERWLVANAIT